MPSVKGRPATKGSFKKKHTGNPGGRPKKTDAIRLAEVKFRDLTPAIAERFKEIILHSTDERAVIAAASKVIEYTMTRPSQPVDMNVRHELQALSNEEILARLKAKFSEHQKKLPKGEGADIVTSH